MIRPLIARHVYTPLYYTFYGKFDYGSYLKFLRKSQWQTLEENRKVQSEMLHRLLSYSVQNIPYYHDIARKNNIRLTKDNAEQALRKFPILTKDIIRKESDRLHKLRPGIRWYNYASGGSTGEPIQLIHDFEYKMKMLLQKRLQKEWAGVHIGDIMVKLWGSEVDVVKEKEDIRHRLMNWVNSIYVLNAFVMDDERMRAYIDIINKVRPKFILAYANSLYDLSLFMSRHRLKVHAPHAIMTSAIKLYPEQRELIERMFGCAVFDRYGTREVGDIASECEKHDGLHVSMFMHYIEILDDDLLPCGEGETGNLYVTLLTNYTMPLIRYRIGDMAKATSKQCPCGRGLPLIREVVGREMDNFIAPGGKMVPGGLFVYCLGIAIKDGMIDKFQVLQRAPDKIEILAVVRDKEALTANKHHIEKPLRKAMGPACKITWKHVSKIPQSKSGKTLNTVRCFRCDK
jgi:phenylacetate-CoA ligase